jgi:hypothetical protein
MNETLYITFGVMKLKLLRYPAQGTGISVVVRETNYLSFNVKN